MSVSTGSILNLLHFNARMDIFPLVKFFQML
uniref:Uncharacterized protein n=1 Tax=Arundo donax TaxID=35708 RepID=A0A0A9FBY1_ARUDO